jgi:hypothetical protein
MVSFRFSKNPPEELGSNLQVLNGFESEQLSEFVEILLQFLSSSGLNLVEAIREFAEKHKANAAALKNLVSSALYFFQGALRSNLTPLMVKEDLSNFGISAENAELVAGLWKSYFLLLSRAVMGSTLMVNQVVDMEWKFGVTAANSELGKAGNSFLQLKLVLDKGI